MCKSSHSPATFRKLNLLNIRPTYALSPTIPDQNMRNLSCTHDHHAVPRVPVLNLRPVESGINPTIFQPVKKIIPLKTTSQSGHDESPLCQTNTRSPRSKLAYCRSFHFPERETVGVDRLSGVKWVK